MDQRASASCRGKLGTLPLPDPEVVGDRGKEIDPDDGAVLPWYLLHIALVSYHPHN